MMKLLINLKSIIDSFFSSIGGRLRNVLTPIEGGALCQIRYIGNKKKTITRSFMSDGNGTKQKIEIKEEVINE